MFRKSQPSVQECRMKMVRKVRRVRMSAQAVVQVRINETAVWSQVVITRGNVV